MVTVSAIVDSHQVLAAKLTRFSYPVAAGLIAGLAVNPNLHANALRINLLAHLVATACRGVSIPDGTHLVEWAGRLMSESDLARFEDPIEDVFIGCVNSSLSGSFRLFVGNTADGDFWVERLISFLEGKKQFPPYAEVLNQALALLRLSDEVAERLELERNQLGGGNAAGRIQVPSRNEITAARQAIRFSADELNYIGISIELLKPFILTDAHRTDLIKETMGNSMLERRPLISSDGGIEMIAPMFVANAVQRLIIDCIVHSGLGGWADMFFQTESASLFINDVASRMGIEKIDFEAPVTPDCLPPLYPFFGEFDFGKPAILLTYCPSFATASADYGGVHAFKGDQTKALTEFLDACAEKFERMPGFSGGLILLNFFCVKTVAFGFPKTRDQWQFHSTSLPDWLILSTHGECTAMRLWKLGKHENRLTSSGTKIINLAGLLNLYAYWKQNGYRFMRRDMNPDTTLLHITCDFAVTLRTGALKAEDEHCVRSHDGSRWVRLIRHNSRPLFAEDNETSLYQAKTLESGNQLTGCLEGVGTRWWIVVLPIKNNLEIARLIYQIWDCVLSWTAPLARVAEKQWLDHLPTSVELIINLPDIADWTFEKKERAPSETLANLRVATDKQAARVTVDMPSSFLHNFSNPKNIAETQIVSALLNGIAKLSGSEISIEERSQLVKDIIRNEDARYFHLTQAHGLEESLADSNRPSPIFVADEDLAYSRIGLADLVGRPAGQVKGLPECENFLYKCVLKVWERIEEQLRPFNHASVVSSCIAALNEIERDANHWDLTTRSLLAMHRNTDDVHDVISGRRSNRSRASLGNRLLIETTQYACSSGDTIFTEADHRSLLAEVVVLLELAHHRDAISLGFMEPVIDLFPNGELGIDEAFYRKVIGQYFSRRSFKTTERAAANYEEFFLKENPWMLPDLRHSMPNSLIWMPYSFRNMGSAVINCWILSLNSTIWLYIQSNRTGFSVRLNFAPSLPIVA